MVPSMFSIEGALSHLNTPVDPPLQITRDLWQNDPTYVVDDPPKGFERPPILDSVGQMA